MLKPGLALALCLGLLAPTAHAELSAADGLRLKRAEVRGRLIYEMDQAAWRSTDELRRRVPQEAFPSQGGWVVEPHDGLMRVTYFGIADDRFYAVFRADMRGSKVIDSHVFAPNEANALSAPALQMARARIAAVGLTGDKPSCTQGPLNTVVVPADKTSEPTAVYLLSPMVKTGVYPFGGHYRIDIGADGGLVSETSFSKACMNVDMAEAPDSSAAFGTTELTSPTPTEIHVFMSLWMARPLMVITPQKQIWMIQNGEIKSAGSME